MKTILYSARKETNITLNCSLVTEKNLLFIWNEKSPRKTHTIEEKISIPPLIIVHHIKKSLTAAISIITLLSLRASKIFYGAIPMAQFSASGERNRMGQAVILYRRCINFNPV
jgi:hypothetical protein